MPNTTVPAAATGLPIIIPFPAGRARPPASPFHRHFDDWTRARNTALAARAFGSTEDTATEMVRSTILEGGAGAVARMLDQLAEAIGLLRGVEAELVAADKLIATAADRVLAEASL